MISIRHSRDYCKEYWKIENYKEAISSDEKWQCHHRLEFMPFSGKNVSSDVREKRRQLMIELNKSRKGKAPWNKGKKSN